MSNIIELDPKIKRMLQSRSYVQTLVSIANKSKAYFITLAQEKGWIDFTKVKDKEIIELAKLFRLLDALEERLAEGQDSDETVDTIPKG